MLQNREGQTIPNVTFKTRVDNQWVDVTTEQLFNNKTVVVFSLPGAFTPTCSSSHVPRYNELADAFKKNGVDDIVCISVNDTFVMNEWKKDQKAEKINFIPDGNGEFSDQMGMLVDKDNIGFGKRSWRYSMLVRNNTIEKMFIEPDVEGDPFEVSDADTMLKHINPKAEEPAFAFLFSKEGCPHCARAKKLLDENKIQYEEAVIGKGITTRAIRAATGKSTTPQVFIRNEYIGGADELAEYFAKQGQRAA